MKRNYSQRINKGVGDFIRNNKNCSKKRKNMKNNQKSFALWHPEESKDIKNKKKQNKLELSNTVQPPEFQKKKQKTLSSLSSSNPSIIIPYISYTKMEKRFFSSFSSLIFYYILQRQNQLNLTKKSIMSVCTTTTHDIKTREPTKPSYFSSIKTKERKK